MGALLDWHLCSNGPGPPAHATPSTMPVCQSQTAVGLSGMSLSSSLSLPDYKSTKKKNKQHSSCLLSRYCILNYLFSQFVSLYQNAWTRSCPSLPIEPVKVVSTSIMCQFKFSSSSTWNLGWCSKGFSTNCLCFNIFSITCVIYPWVFCIPFNFIDDSLFCISCIFTPFLLQSGYTSLLVFCFFLVSSLISSPASYAIPFFFFFVKSPS